MDSYVADRMIELGFRQAVMGSYPSETVTSLPEYSNLDPNFWNIRRGCGATVGSPVGCNAEEDVLCYSSDLYLTSDLWWGYVGSYAMTNSDEYFAEGLMSYFD